MLSINDLFIILGNTCVSQSIFKLFLEHIVLDLDGLKFLDVVDGSEKATSKRTLNRELRLLTLVKKILFQNI